MNNYSVDWVKNYFASGTEIIQAESREEAERIARENIGDWEGSMQYAGDEDYVYAYERKGVE